MSEVYFIKEPDKVDKLFDAAGIGKIISKDDYVALKIHFGERGNSAYLKPERTKPIIRKVKEYAGKPFWTDANTLYKGSRRDTLSHLQTAFDHGYTFGKTGAHVLIADGLEGKAYKKVKAHFKHFKEIFVAPLIFEADVLLAVSHFKGHDVTGFGGAIKNIGMGLGSRAGKQQMHADIKPKVDNTICNACGRCLKWCPEDAISWGTDGKAEINLEKCIGCAECVATCRLNAISISWSGTPNSVQEKIAEYTAGILQHFKKKCAFINFIIDVSPNCDCYNFNDAPIVPDLGIAVSFDPVAIDQACLDLVNQSEGRINSKDKFKSLWPEVDGTIQLQYAEKIGLGSRTYDLITV